MQDFFTQVALQPGVQVHSKPDDMSVEVSISSAPWWNPFRVTNSYTVVSADSTVVSARIVARRSTQSWQYRMGGYVMIQSGGEQMYFRLLLFLWAVISSSAQDDKLKRIMTRDKTVFEENEEQRQQVYEWCLDRFREDVTHLAMPHLTRRD